MLATNSHQSNTKVGIFMPAYNQGLYISEAIESLKKQTFQDFKVIIADDASTDGITVDILKKIRYEKGEVYFGEKNQGIGVLECVYLEKLNTEYVFVLNADDKLKPTYIEECVNYLDSHPGCGAVATLIECFGDIDRDIEVDEDNLHLPNMLISNGFLGSALSRYQVMKDLGFGIKDKPFKKHSDYDRWVSMLEKGWDLGVIKKHLFLYRQLSTSLSHSINKSDELNFRSAFIDKHRKLFNKYYKYVILDLYKKNLDMVEWEKELSKKTWLDDQYQILNSKIKDKDLKIKELEEYIKTI